MDTYHSKYIPSRAWVEVPGFGFENVPAIEGKDKIANMKSFMSTNIGKQDVAVMVCYCCKCVYVSTHWSMVEDELINLKTLGFDYMIVNTLCNECGIVFGSNERNPYTVCIKRVDTVLKSLGFDRLNASTRMFLIGGMWAIPSMMSHRRTYWKVKFKSGERIDIIAYTQPITVMQENEDSN